MPVRLENRAGGAQVLSPRYARDMDRHKGWRSLMLATHTGSICAPIHKYLIYDPQTRTPSNTNLEHTYAHGPTFSFRFKYPAMSCEKRQRSGPNEHSPLVSRGRQRVSPGSIRSRGRFLFILWVCGWCASVGVCGATTHRLTTPKSNPSNAPLLLSLLPIPAPMSLPPTAAALRWGLHWRRGRRRDVDGEKRGDAVPFLHSRGKWCGLFLHYMPGNADGCGGTHSGLMEASKVRPPPEAGTGPGGAGAVMAALSSAILPLEMIGFVFRVCAVCCGVVAVIRARGQVRVLVDTTY